MNAFVKFISISICLVSCSLVNANLWEMGEPESDQQTELRSAFLGNGIWSSEGDLCQEQIDQQLTRHFMQVIKILENQQDTSINEALDRIEQSLGTVSIEQRNALRIELEQRRAKQLQTLREYSLRGQFPQNNGQAATAVPIFVDESGTHCAVGYLMHRSGSDDVVQQIVDTNNLVYVYDINSGPAMDWIMYSGLTQSEAALIQPSYKPPTFDATLADFEDPAFTISQFGMTVSDLEVLSVSFQPTTSDLETLFNFAVFEVDSLGLPFAEPESLGIALGEGPHDAYITYTPNLNNWVFLGPMYAQSLGDPEPGDNAIMYRFRYRISSGDETISLATIASDQFFNGNFVAFDGYIRVSTVLTTKSNTLGQGTIESFFVLDDVAFIEAGASDVFVTTYALDVRPPDSLSSDGFTSFWNEFEIVLVGDVNCDGEIDLLDVQPFIDAIANDFPDVKADINMDGSDDLLDVAGFVQLLATE